MPFGAEKPRQNSQPSSCEQNVKFFREATYSFKVGHVGGVDRRSNETQVVDARLVRAVLVVFHKHLPHSIIHILFVNHQHTAENLLESNYGRFGMARVTSTKSRYIEHVSTGIGYNFNHPSIFRPLSLDLRGSVQTITGNGPSHRRGRNGDFCVTVGFATTTAGTLA